MRRFTVVEVPPTFMTAPLLEWPPNPIKGKGAAAAADGEGEGMGSSAAGGRLNIGLAKILLLPLLT